VLGAAGWHTGLDLRKAPYRKQGAMSAGEQLGLKQDAAARQASVVERHHVEGVLLFFFVPWSAINLVDYYLVKRGRYDVASFFTPNGIYGRIQWWACLCYVITLAVQVPFLDQPFFVGSLVKPLGGADISWIVGFAVASLLYLAGRGASTGSGRSCRRPLVRLCRVTCGGGVNW
jgi:hypothetical protein